MAGHRVRSIVAAVKHYTGSAYVTYHHIPRARLAELMQRQRGMEMTRRGVRNVRQYIPVR